jgi:hypothetical protein
VALTAHRRKKAAQEQGGDWLAEAQGEVEAEEVAPQNRKATLFECLSAAIGNVEQEKYARLEMLAFMSLLQLLSQKRARN